MRDTDPTRNLSVAAGNRGFSMIELIVALLVFCIGFVGINKMQTMAIRGNAYSMQMTEATNVMKSTAERIMGLAEDSNSLGGEEGLSATSTFSSPQVKPSGTAYTPSWTVSQVAGTSIREVTVTVRWTDMGADHRVEATFCR